MCDKTTKLLISNFLRCKIKIKNTTCKAELSEKLTENRQQQKQEHHISLPHLRIQKMINRILHINIWNNTRSRTTPFIKYRGRHCQWISLETWQGSSSVSVHTRDYGEFHLRVGGNAWANKHVTSNKSIYPPLSRTLIHELQCTFTECTVVRRGRRKAFSCLVTLLLQHYPFDHT